MNYKSLMEAVESTIKEHNLPWDVDQQGCSVIINFNEAAYAPNGTWGLGLWLNPYTMDSIDEQIYHGQDNGFGPFNAERFVEDMQEARDNEDEDIPDDETLLADAKRIEDDIQDFCRAMAQKESSWLVGESRRARDLASKIAHEVIEPIAKPVYDLYDLFVATSPYKADDEGMYWNSYYLYVKKNVKPEDEEKVEQELLSAALGEWEPYKLMIQTNARKVNTGIELFIDFSFLLPYAE